MIVCERARPGDNQRHNRGQGIGDEFSVSRMSPATIGTRKAHSLALPQTLGSSSTVTASVTDSAPHSAWDEPMSPLRRNAGHV